MTGYHVRRPRSLDGIGDESPDALAYRVCLTDPDRVTAEILHVAIRHVRRDSAKVGELMARHGHLFLAREAEAARNGPPREPDVASRIAAMLAARGVGSHLWLLLEECGVEHPRCGDCLRWAEQLNAWGVAGCRLERETIKRRIVNSRREYGVFRSVMTAARALVERPAWLVWTDPYGSLIDEAIRRAETDAANDTGTNVALSALPTRE